MGKAQKLKYQRKIQESLLLQRQLRKTAGQAKQYLDGGNAAVAMLDRAMTMLKAFMKIHPFLLVFLMRKETRQKSRILLDEYKAITEKDKK